MTDRGLVRDQLLVTLCYWAFTLSDGALRMLVLLHLHATGQTPLALALVLLPYEAAGVFANLLAGWLGARAGLKATLVAGLGLQVVACLMLAAEPEWLSVGYVMATQVLSGIAKDLAKTAAKSYVRTLAPAASSSGLFRLVALLTGSKNAWKGLGFFLGGALLATAGFRGTNLALAVLLAALLACACLWLPDARGRRTAGLAALFAHAAAVNWLAAARLFLFGSRDAWFAVALPLFLTAQLGWTAPAVGAFLAVWVVGYGVVQATAPRFVRAPTTALGARAVVHWTVGLLLPLLATLAALREGAPPAATVVAGLCVYGVLFAVASSLHSWLVVALGSGDDTAERVGFYYAANALGRLCGTFASGWLFAAAGEGLGGLQACLWASCVAVVAAAAAASAAQRAATSLTR